ncbi:Prostaglandin reductase 2 [Wickerhamomyces ciferrii]|uniref:Prostaglandin reductase 2 n=1 Tax=Wickerhamomyces ciferrii (strain ATCC 14091 / BCRC 22168 / CBS 111 / JCM 3599 / NBRC 0793 / NRRL Y-1031 F-60-10) TaxID=1206466 RepID=K0KMF9_WICCF|nr:Prostaglandin reductase 2 [Wickerhamomyces ciferrii]CCH44166.1 Prostaglandin reductase 2 [Wickerhamomyces ciferrii]
MSNVINAQHWILENKTTFDQPINLNYGSKDATFILEDVKYDLNDSKLLKKGELLIESLFFSNDPAQKGWWSKQPGYVAPSPPHSPAPSRGIAKVIKANSENYKEGDIISSNINWATHNIIPEAQFGTYKIDPTRFDSLTKYLSVFGSTTLTAYVSAYKYAELTDPENSQDKVFLVTGAAGAVGAVLVQIFAKVFKAKKVLAVAGGDEKVKYVESLGNGNVYGLDYKSKTYKEDFAKAIGDDKIDVYVDQVGGEILDHASFFLKDFGRIVQVGTIAGYNDISKAAFKAYSNVVTKRLSIRGFIVSDDREQFPQIIQHLSELIKSGVIDASKIKETVVDGSGENFKKVPELWNGLFSGKNTGKYITRVTSDPNIK